MITFPVEWNLKKRNCQPSNLMSMESDPSRVISIRVSESELSNINFLLSKLGYSSIGDLLKAIATGKYLVNQGLVNEIVNQTVSGLTSSVLQLFTDHANHSTLERWKVFSHFLTFLAFKGKIH